MGFRDSKVAMTSQSRLKRVGPIWLFVLVLICSFCAKESSAHFTSPISPRPSNFEISELLARLQQDPLVAGTELLQAGQKLDAENTNESHLKAIEKYKEAAKLFHASKVNLGEAVALLAVASSYSSLHQDQNTLEYAKMALPLLEGTENDRTILASTL
ncbi:MAG: hypothetical protein DMF69_19235, partial [Acidobacteria bacterium]